MNEIKVKTEHQKNIEELDYQIRARRPIIYICTHEEERIMNVLLELTNRPSERKWRLHSWDLASGLGEVVKVDSNKDQPSKQQIDQIDVLNWFLELNKDNAVKETNILVLKDFHQVMGYNGSVGQIESTLIRQLRNMSTNFAYENKTIIIMGASLYVPDDIEKSTFVIDWSLPEYTHIKDLLTLAMEKASNSALKNKFKLTYTPSEIDGIVQAFQGLTISEIELLIKYMFLVSKEFDISIIASRKRDIIRKSGFVEWVENDVSLDNIGGLENFKSWIHKRKDSFSTEAHEYGLPEFPKGILLLGIQGCGKSLTAKAIASQWKLPLLKFDVGRIFNSGVGSSEANMRFAVKTAESVAPCVFWIDELDKGFSGLGSSNFSDGGTAARVFGYFYTWMQDKQCYDEETEVLTNEGWKKFDNLTQLELIATRNKEGEFQWQQPLSYLKSSYNGPMISFKSKTTDILVTPEHRMLVQYCHGGRMDKEFILPASAIINKKHTYRVPMKSEWKGEIKSKFILPEVSYKRGKSIIKKPALEIDMNIWMAFLGIYLSEGWVNTGSIKPGSTYYRIGISQTKIKTTEEIKQLLNKMPFNWKYSNGEFICQDIRLYNYCKQFGKHQDKFIPREFLDLEKDQLTILWKWLVKGDGNIFETKKNKIQRTTYGTTSSQLAGNIQELLQKIGFDGSISSYNPSNPGYIKEKIVKSVCKFYTIRQRTAKNRALYGSILNYNGNVYCLSVLNGIIYTRRNGKPTWCGNSPVYIVATANDISNLPPELLRKGRFDEIFWVDLPTSKERAEIFKICFKNKKRNPKDFNMEILVANSKEYSGAEIDSAIDDALHESYSDGKRALTTDDVVLALKNTIPLSKLMAEKIQTARAWAVDRTRSASQAKHNAIMDTSKDSFMESIEMLPNTPESELAINDEESIDDLISRKIEL